MRCPTCQKVYKDPLQRFCFDDGTPLEQSPDIESEPPTLEMNSSTEGRAATPTVVSHNPIFRRLEGMMPDLLAEMRRDLAQYPLRRKFVLLQKAWVYNPAGDELAYYYDDIPELESKIEILKNRGLIREVRFSDQIDMFKFTEEFVDYLAE